MMPDEENIRNFEDKLIALTKRTGYEIVQNNGQRIYSLPGRYEVPPKGCEVFIGKIPRDVLEDELVPIFEKIGKVYQFRLMMDFSGMNRGYGFATYFKPEDANLAVTLLHGFAIRRTKQIGVYKSLDNCRLFVGGIPSNVIKEDVFEALSQYVEGIKEVIMYPSHSSKDLNRGFIFVEFHEHRLAAMARRKLAPGSLVLWGVPILVDWADPLPEVDNIIMSKVKKLYLRNLNTELSNEDLHIQITKIVPSEEILKTHKILDFAFVHFITREAAEQAMILLKGWHINDEPVEVMWARPRIYSKSYRTANPPQHFCVSLPPRTKKLIQINKNLNSGHSCDSSSQQSPVSSRSSSSFNPIGLLNNPGQINPNIGLRSQVLLPFFENGINKMNMLQDPMIHLRYSENVYCRNLNVAPLSMNFPYNINV